MTRETKRKISTVIRYTLLIAVGFVMVYPLIWMVGATFKTNSEIFTSAWFWPKNPVFDGYNNAFKSYGGKINLLTSMLNTYKIVVPKVVFTVISATITAYGFARFEFKGKAILFSLMISTLFLPQVVLNAPQYIMFNKWGWTNSYLPLVVPSLFAADTYFVFMLVQFLRGVPKELEEAAKIDGTTGFGALFLVVMPIAKPGLISVAIYTFINAWEEFLFAMNLSMSTKTRTLPIAINAFAGEFAVDWGATMAAAALVALPVLALFLLCNRYFVQGLSDGAVKG